MKKERSSNIELLRIVAMLMIIVYHIWCHAIAVQLSNDTVYFIKPIVYKKLFIFDIISPFGQIANAIFILISGYFMCGKKNINLVNISKKLLTQLMYATVILVFASTIVYKIFQSTYIDLIGINFINAESWFIGYYFLIIIIGFLFLNNFLDNSDKKTYITFLIVLFTLIQLPFSRQIVEEISKGTGTLLIGIFLYSLGGYIKKYNPFKIIKTRYLLFGIMMVYTLVLISSYNLTSTSIEHYYKALKVGVFTHETANYDNYYFIPVILAILILEIFTRLKIRKNKLINFIGSSTLMIYLLQDNKFFYSLWLNTNWVKLLYDNPISFFYKYLIWVLGVFEVGILVYITYYIFNKYIIERNINKILHK